MGDFTHSGFTQKRRQDELLKVAEQAAAWLIALEEGGAQERAEFAQWVEESPLHLEMYLRASSVDRITELMAPEDVSALSQRTSGDQGTVIEWGDPPPAAPARGSNFARDRIFSVLRRRMLVGFPRLVAVATGVLALVAGGAWYELLGPGTWDSFRTGVGEQRIVQLSDGSVIYINTDSRIEVRYSEAARDIRLLEGEALFKVERDARRPFEVHVGDKIVQAVGTQFNVYRRSNGTKVAVVEGVVQVSESGGGWSIATRVSNTEGGAAVTASRSAPQRLAAGEGVSISEDGAVEKRVSVNVEGVTAWRERRLVFEWQTLEEIAAEFNRYNRVPQIRVEGASVRTRRYTAVFDAGNPQTLLKFLAKDDDLKFSADGDDFVIQAR